MKTYDEIREYVRREARHCEVRQIGSYESEPYDLITDRDNNGEDIVESVTTTVSVHLLGDEQHGYILATSDDADGPTDDLGTEVYPTAAAAIAAMLSRGADLLPAGEAIA